VKIRLAVAPSLMALRSTLFVAPAPTDADAFEIRRYRAGGSLRLSSKPVVWVS
jgi:hypothetical protein